MLFSTDVEKRLIVEEEYVLRKSENRLLKLVLVPEAESDIKMKENYSMKYILRNNQQMQLYAVNFIPLLCSLYMFRVLYTPIIRSTIFETVSTATGTDHSIVSATYSQRGLQATLEVSN